MSMRLCFTPVKAVQVATDGWGSCRPVPSTLQCSVLPHCTVPLLKTGENRIEGGALMKARN